MEIKFYYGNQVDDIIAWGPGWLEGSYVFIKIQSANSSPFPLIDLKIKKTGFYNRQYLAFVSLGLYQKYILYIGMKNYDFHINDN